MVLKKDKFNCYLCGPMEYTEDEGLPWRLEFRKKLEHLDVHCIIPNEEQDIISSQEDLNELKNGQDIDEYFKIMREFIKIDLDFVRNSDFIVARWNGERMSGTIGEAQEAYLKDIPVFLITEEPIEDIPGWFLACCEDVFANIDDFVSYLTIKLENT